jgi:hypothetical protein
MHNREDGIIGKAKIIGQEYTKNWDKTGIGEQFLSVPVFSSGPNNLVLSG